MKEMKCLDCNEDKSPKGKYCKSCGYKHRIQPKRGKGTYKLIHNNPTWYTKGDSRIVGNKSRQGSTPWNKDVRGIHMSPQTEFKKGISPWNKGREYLRIRDDNHPNWKGNDVGYGALHSWVKRRLGFPKVCSNCGTTSAKFFDWANKSGLYLRDLSDWIRLCRKCHHSYDRITERGWITRRNNV